jgi:hypothetical protein
MEHWGCFRLNYCQIWAHSLSFSLIIKMEYCVIPRTDENSDSFNSS